MLGPRASCPPLVAWPSWPCPLTGRMLVLRQSGQNAWATFPRGMAILAMSAHGQDARATAERAEYMGYFPSWHGHPGHVRSRAGCPCYGRAARMHGLLSLVAWPSWPCPLTGRMLVLRQSGQNAWATFPRGMAILAMSAHGQDARATAERAEYMGYFPSWHGHPGHVRSRAGCPCYGRAARMHGLLSLVAWPSWPCPLTGRMPVLRQSGQNTWATFPRGMAILAMSAHGLDARATAERPECMGYFPSWHGHPGHVRSRAGCSCYGRAARMHGLLSLVAWPSWPCPLTGWMPVLRQSGQNAWATFPRGMAILAMSAHGLDARATAERPECMGYFPSWHGHPGHVRSRAGCSCHGRAGRMPAVP